MQNPVRTTSLVANLSWDSPVVRARGRSACFMLLVSWFHLQLHRLNRNGEGKGTAVKYCQSVEPFKCHVDFSDAFSASVDFRQCILEP